MLFSLHRKVIRMIMISDSESSRQILNYYFFASWHKHWLQRNTCDFILCIGTLFFPFFFFFEKDKINQNKAIRRIRTEWNTRNRYPQPPPLLLLQMAKSDLSVIVFCIKDNWYVTRNRWFFIFCWHNSLAQLVYTYYKLVL